MNDNVPVRPSGGFHSLFAEKTDNGQLLFHDRTNGTQYMLCAFAGQSMLPTLRDGDLLELVDYGSQPVKGGDIICFRTDRNDDLIIHRVVGVGTDGLRTRGDGNALDDAGRVRHSEIVGRVVAVRRGERRFEIQRGRIGVLPMQRQRLIRRITRRLKREMSKRLLAAVPAHPLIRLLPAKLRPRVVFFDKRTRLFMANHCIGEFDTGSKRWHIPGWHRFFIETAKLPSLAETSSVRDTSPE